MLSWMLALVMMVGMVPATFATPASAAETDGGAITEWEANALLAGAGTSVVQVALDNHFDDPNTDEYGMCGGNSHLQGIAVDDELKYMFFSYTSALAIIEIATGELVASCGGFGQGSFGTPGGSHLGCIDYYDGHIYGSLEYKDPGKKFFLAIFDVERMLEQGVGVSVSEQDMDEPICTAVLLEEPTRDFRAAVDTNVFSGQDEFGHATNEANNGHYFACSGIDGVSMGKWPGGKDDEIYMIVAYGVYQFSSSARQDNTYNVLEYYKLSDIWNADGTQTQWNKSYTYTDGIHQDWAKDEAAWLAAAKTLYVYTGNTSYGSQNIEYEWDTGDVVLYTYGNTDGMGGTYYEVDGSVEPELKTLNLGQHSSDTWAQSVAKAYKDYPGAVAIDDDGYMMGYVGTLKCVCGKPENHTTEGNWPTGAPKADNFICSSSAPASATTGIAWIGPDPDNADADWFYVADASLSTGLFKRTYDDKGGVAFTKKVWLPEEPLDAEPVMHWTMDAASLDFETGTMTNAIDENTYGGMFQNVQIAKGMDGKVGGSIYFDGEADATNYSRVWMDEAGIDLLQALMDKGEITISYWYKPEYSGAETFTSNWSPILGIYSDVDWNAGNGGAPTASRSDPGRFVLVTEDRSGALNMCMNNYSGAAGVSWPIDVRSAGTTAHHSVAWHHIVMTVNLNQTSPRTGLTGGTSLHREFYVDGIKVGQDRALYPSLKDTLFDGISDFEIGGAPFKAWADTNIRGRFSGWIDDVKIYDVSVTDKQAAWLINNTPKTADFDMADVPEVPEVEIETTYVFDKANPADLTINGVEVSMDVLMQYQPGPATVEGETVYIINGADGYAMLNYALTADGTDSANGKDAAVINGVTFSADNGAFFDGYEETRINRVQLANTDFIDQAIADQATITFEFKSQRLVGNIANMVGLYDADRPAMVAQIRDSGGERPGDGDKDHGTSQKVSVAGQVFTDSSKAWDGNVVETANGAIALKKDAEWHTCAIVYDGNEMSLYLDGALVKTGNVADGALDGADALVLGGPVNINYASGVGSSKSERKMTNLYGNLKNVVVYNAALTAEQIAAGPNDALDVSGLEYLIEKAAPEAAKTKNYTTSSLNALVAALAAAEDALADETLTEEVLNQAAADLLAAYDGLKKVNKEPVVISAITVEAGEGGTAKADYLNAPAGTEVTITATPDEGKQVASITVNGKAITGTTFKMPAEAVTVVVTFADAGEHICPSEKFDDVDTSLWYHNAIDYVVANGLMAGVADDAFAPNATTTRGMIVTILYSLEGKPAVAGDAFADVDEDDWYFNAVNWAAVNGIVAGYGDDKFGPNDNVTREQLVAILKAYAAYKKADVAAAADLAAYADADAISAWAVDAVKWGVAEGIISGKSADTLDPTGNALRCEVAQMMMKFVAG